MYKDRRTAGCKLVETVQERNVDVDRVFGILRGALPVSDAVAEGIDCQLDVIDVRRIEASNRDDVSVGSVTPDGDL